MKKLSSILIACSLTLAGAALAQQPVEQQSPSKGKRAPEKTRATEAKPKPNAAKHETSAPKQRGAIKERGATSEPAMKEHGATNEPGAGKGPKAAAKEESATAPKSNVSGQEGSAATPSTRQQRIEERRKGMKGPAAAKTTTSPAAAPAGAGAAPPTAPAGQQNVQANAGAKAKKPDPQKVQQIKTQHANFRAQPKPQQVPTVTYNQNYRIQNSEHWQGQQYEAFRSYHPEWHDQSWYRTHYNRVELIGGGYYFWNNGYWYPAWGYSPSAQYYAYDGPIYVGQRAEPPDKVIADVQAVLQEMGYYRGEVDGLLGPLTREALTAYQADNGLTTTAAIDQPTLDSLDMG
jgi:Putative peptidoglycan binding domain